MLVGITDQNDLWKQMKFISVNLRNGNEVLQAYSLLGFNDRYIKNDNIFDIFSSLKLSSIFVLYPSSFKSFAVKFVCFEEDIIWIYALKYFNWDNLFTISFKYKTSVGRVKKNWPKSKKKFGQVVLFRGAPPMLAHALN